MNDTIAAISTALGEGAISIIRISGDQAIEIVEKLTQKDFSKINSHSITYHFIKDFDTNEVVDEVFISIFRAPKSFTCEDVVEINCHGGVYITRRVLQLVLGCGARLALPGEFTQRAFMNGRIDLTQAESIMDMITAPNKIASKQAIHGLCGSVKKLLEPFIQDVLDIIAQIEVNIDYPEYDDVEELCGNKLRPIVIRWLSQIQEVIEQGERGKIFKAGIRTAIIGKPNVGKSSLLNALLEEEKAIVTDIAGTTRDIVEGEVVLKNITLQLIDTAGIRQSEDVVEKIGIDRSFKEIEDADLIIVVVDATTINDEETETILNATKNKKRIVVYNKCDLQKPPVGTIGIVAKDKKIDALVDKLEELYMEDIEIVNRNILANERQIGLVRQAKTAMEKVLEALDQNVAIDLLAIDIQEVYRCLKEVFGEYHREDLLDALFSNFCLGK